MGSKDKETRELIIDSAREEFSKLGYQKSSLRNICKNAGVTTGAVYFFFKDKEDLFSAVVEPFVKEVEYFVVEHIKSENANMKIAQAKVCDGTEKSVELTADITVAEQIVSLYYNNIDIAKILLEGSQGTTFENFADIFVERLYHMMLSQCEECDSPYLLPENVDKWIVHWFSHICVDSFLQLFAHFDNEQDAMEQVVSVIKILHHGYFGLF